MWNWWIPTIKSFYCSWEPYDPAWLVAAASKQYPDKPWLSDALSKCTTMHRSGSAYIYFVDARRANKPGSPWQFRENIILEETEAGDIVLDILKDGRVGGIEFLRELGL
jgi:uncharacterized protein YuzE